MELVELVEVTKSTSIALLKQVVRLERRIFPKHESLGDGLLFEAAKTHSTLVLALDAQDPGSVCGYLLFRRSGAEGHIDKLAVAERSRRQGVGRQLLQFALASMRSRRATSAHLAVDVERSGAIALYEAAGFQRITTRRDFYRPGRHALLMQQSLS